MQIPESIEKLTTTVTPDPFSAIAKSIPIPLDEIVTAVRRSLDTKDLSSFDFGFTYYKQDASNAKVLIKNFINLLSQSLTKAINESEINADNKDGIVFETKNIIDSLEHNFEANYNILLNLNNNKNMLDANAIALIMLGYAIGLLKKKYNS